MIQEKVLSIMSDVFKVRKEMISIDSTQEDFEQWDSMGHLILIVKIEKEFNINIPIEKSINMTDVKRIINFIKQAKK